MQVTLPAIAFGGSARTAPIPPAGDPWSAWYRAVALGGGGRYAAAGAELDRIERADTVDVLRSLAASTRAAHLRQAGRHDLAVSHDARALVLAAGCELENDGSGESVRGAALCDALTGLAADDLGRGMFGASRRLLDRVKESLTARAEAALTPGDWVWTERPALRLHWVEAELAMYTGDPARAIEHARAASEISGRCPSVRHRIKTDLIGAAAAASAGDVPTATARALRVSDEAARFGQLPLQWAAAKLLDGIGGGARWVEQVEDLRHELAKWGGAMQ